MIRAVALVAFSAILLVLKNTSAWAWALAAAGVTTAAWTVYAHIIRKDPLVEALYQVVGGEEEYEKLPEFDTGCKPHFTVDMINKGSIWDKLTNPALRATTEDGRKVLVVKCSSRDLKQTNIAQAHMKKVIAFIEKFGPEDMSEYLTPAAVKFHQGCLAFYSFQSMLNFPLGISSNSGIQRIESEEILSGITAEMANEFYAQM